MKIYQVFDLKSYFQSIYYKHSTLSHHITLPLWLIKKKKCHIISTSDTELLHNILTAVSALKSHYIAF